MADDQDNEAPTLLSNGIDFNDRRQVRALCVQIAAAGVGKTRYNAARTIDDAEKFYLYITAAIMPTADPEPKRARPTGEGG